MIEIREYKIAELVEILGTRNRQGIRRKLMRYGCEFEETGWGKSVVFNILTAPDKFNVFCITELNIPAQVDLRRLKMFYYAFFEDEKVMIMSDVDRENYMDEHYEHTSRQTIRNWIGYLERENLIDRDTVNCRYCAVKKSSDGKKTVEEISKEIYKNGWDEYWHYIKEEGDCYYAFSKACDIWGGAVCRIPRITINGIEWAKTKRLKEIIIDSMLNE